MAKESALASEEMTNQEKMLKGLTMAFKLTNKHHKDSTLIS